MYDDLIARLRTRAAIRREIRLRNGGGNDRIADDLIAAADAIEDLQTLCAYSEWRDEY